MSFLNKISQRYKVYPYGEASSENSIQNLKNFCAVPIPEEYFENKREKEIEISIKDKDGYVGKSTRKQIEYSELLNKRVLYYSKDEINILK